MGPEYHVERVGHHGPIRQHDINKGPPLIKALIPSKFSHVGLMCVSMFQMACVDLVDPDPCILDLIAHRLRQEIHENREKTKGNCPLNAEITPEKESDKSTSIEENLRLNLSVNRVSSVIPL